MSSNEILRVTALRDWLITFDEWQDWVGSADEDVLSERIAWPTTTGATEFPQMVIEVGGTRYRNQTGAAAGSNFQPSGEIRLLIWDLDEAPNNTQTSYEYFANHFFQLLEEMATKAHESALMFDVVYTEPNPIVHTSQNENYEGDQAMWHGVIRIQWGMT